MKAAKRTAEIGAAVPRAIPINQWLTIGWISAVDKCQHAAGHAFHRMEYDREHAPLFCRRADNNARPDMSDGRKDISLLATLFAGVSARP